MTTRYLSLSALALAGMLCAAAPQGAAAQGARDDRYQGTTQSIAPASRSNAEWSGQSGASGHPLMTVEAISAAAANFSACIEAMWPEAQHRGVTRAVFDTHTRELTPELKIMDLLDAQPEFTKSFWDYLDILITDDRIQRGREILTQYKPVFDKVEQVYGVDRYVLTAFWGVESKFSTAIGDRPVLRSTATLACVGRRQAYFRNEFLASLELLQRGDVRPDHLKGSWAGAFGPTQFMPTTFKRFAVDFDGDGRRDVVDSVPDMLASTANNLKLDGWQRGETWGYEVVVPKNFNFLLADRSRQLTMHEWERLGIRRAGDKPFPRAMLCAAHLHVPAFHAGDRARHTCFHAADLSRGLLSRAGREHPLDVAGPSVSTPDPPDHDVLQRQLGRKSAPAPARDGEKLFGKYLPG